MTDIARLDLFKLARTARTDMLAAMDLLPSYSGLARARFRIPFVVAQDFSTALEVLVANADSYRKPWIVRSIIEEGLGENLFTLDGDEWLTRRQPCAPVFGVQQMGPLTTTISETVAEFVDGWQPGEIDVVQKMTDLTIRVALRALLGTDDETGDLAEQVRHEFEEILGWITHRFNHPASPPAIVPTPRNRRMQRSQARLRTAVTELIDARRAQDSGSVDVLSQLVRAQQTKSHDLTDTDIRDECIGFMFAGHETTASTLMWALYELALRPDLQQQIADEARSLTDGSTGLIPAIDSLEHTSSVVEETLRMYPAGISIARSAKRSTKIGGERIRRGTLVMIPVYRIQRSPHVWNDPDKFDEERDHHGNGEGFLPFGLGPRRCLGARFARNELRIALATICASWSLSYESATPPRATVAPSLQPEGALLLSFVRR